MQVHITKASLRTILALSLSCSFALLMTACGDDGATAPVVTTVTRQAVLSTALEVPVPTLPDAAAPALGSAVSTSSAGSASFTLDPATNKLSGSMKLTAFPLSATTQKTDVTNAHIHDGAVGAAGGVVIGLESNAAGDTWSIPATAPALTADQVAKFKAGALYVNAHTATNGPGVVRGQLISFKDNIQPIFTAKCVECHAPGKIGSTLPLVTASESHDNLVGALSKTSTPGGGTLVFAGDSANSVLFKRLDGNAAGTQMPRVGDRLPDNEFNLISAWIDMGAANN